MIDITVIDGQYIVRGPKCVLVLSRDQFIQALQAGKRWKRRQALAARLAPGGGVPAAAGGREDPAPPSGGGRP